MGHFLEVYMLDKLTQRVSELEREIEQSAARHNILVGMLTEARNMLAIAKSECCNACPDMPAIVEAVE